MGKDIACEAVKNLTIPQAMVMFKHMSRGYTAQGRTFVLLGQAIQAAAIPMVAPVNKLPGNAKDQEELCSFFALTPADVTGDCSHAAVDLPEQTKSLFNETEYVNNYATEYLMMLLLMRRHGENLGLIDVYYACATAKETSIWQWAHSMDEKRKQLKSLKVRTQAYLADSLKSKDKALEIVEAEPPEDLDAFR